MRPVARLSDIRIASMEKVDEIRHSDTRPEQIPRIIATMIYNQEISFSPSSFITAGKKYWLFDGIENRLYPFSSRNRDFMSFFTYRYGLSSADHLTRDVVSIIEGFISTLGTQRELRRFSKFDRPHGVHYLSRYNGTCYRLDGESIQVVPNGVGALFVDDDGGAPLDLTDADIAPHGALQDKLVDGIQFKEVTEVGTTATDQKRLLMFWMLSLAFPDLMPTKPIMLADGQKGSGKTTSMQLIQLALTGRQRAMQIGKRDEDDFGVLLQKAGPVALFDNTDSMLPWLQDAVCAYATGGGWQRRVKFTDDDIIEINPQSFLAFATKNPVSFKRDDVADRCIVLRMEPRLDMKGYEDNDTLFTGVLADRKKIYGEWLFYVNKMVQLMHTKQYYSPAKMPHRLADFARMAYVAGAAIGLKPDEIEHTLIAAQNEREALMIEGDTLLDLIERWVTAQGVGYTPAVPIDNVFNALQLQSKLCNIQFYLKGPTQLANRLRTLGPSLAQHFKVITRVDSVTKQTLYQIRRNEDR